MLLRRVLRELHETGVLVQQQCFGHNGWGSLCDRVVTPLEYTLALLLINLFGKNCVEKIQKLMSEIVLIMQQPNVDVVY